MIYVIKKVINSQVFLITDFIFNQNNIIYYLKSTHPLNEVQNFLT